MMKSIKNLKYKKIVSLLLNQDGDPYFNAKGIAVGVFSGCFPFFGLQTFLGLLLARFTKGNLLLAAIGTWVSNPFTYVPLYFFNYRVGSYLLKSPDDIKIDKNLINSDLWMQGRILSMKLIMGSSLVGLIFGLVFGLFVFLFYKYKKERF